MAATDPALPPPARPGKTRFRMLRTISALVIREMTTTYGRSPGGYIWAIIEPLGMIIFLAFVFSLLLRSPSLGTSFILFYTTGILPLYMYRNVAQNVGASIQFSKALLVYPRITFVDAILARTILAVLNQILVSFVLLSGFYMLEDTRGVLDFQPILISFVMAGLLGLGVGVMNCFLFNMFPIWQTIWNIATRPLLIVSAILYIYEELPPLGQKILWWNPLVHLTGLNRSGFYSYYEPDYISLVYVGVFALVPMFFGFMLLRQFYRYILYK